MRHWIGLKATLDTLLALLGIAILYWGANWLIRGSAQIARAFGVKPLVVGLTVVAYGASAPELTIATQAALTHHEPIALGVVVGSCAANISLILGITALISPPVIDGRIIRREVPVLLGSAIAVPLLFRNGVLSRLEGAALVLCAVVFTIATLAVSSRLEPDDPHEVEARRSEDSAILLAGKGRPHGSRGTAALQTAVGLILLVIGADLFLRGGRGIGKELGISERMLGLTVISLGTALPELVGSIVAASRGNAALAIGSVIGSNVLNVFLVLGVTAYLRPIHAGELIHLSDLIGLVGITLLGILMLRGSRKISRTEGLVLVLAYIAFIATAALF
ncbi:MAG TPA: calcium/sodium antiporter [Kofleriaceae bacterium]|nr:calcium/sodium antiporter [Kofleriaceae bacterium]